jgi:hypothetical protein
MWKFAIRKLSNFIPHVIATEITINLFFLHCVVPELSEGTLAASLIPYLLTSGVHNTKIEKISARNPKIVCRSPSEKNPKERKKNKSSKENSRSSGDFSKEKRKSGHRLSGNHGSSLNGTLSKPVPELSLDAIRKISGWHKDADISETSIPSTGRKKDGRRQKSEKSFPDEDRIGNTSPTEGRREKNPKHSPTEDWKGNTAHRKRKNSAEGDNSPSEARRKTSSTSSPHATFDHLPATEKKKSSKWSRGYESSGTDVKSPKLDRGRQHSEKGNLAKLDSEVKSLKLDRGRQHSEKGNLAKFDSAPRGAPKPSDPSERHHKQNSEKSRERRRRHRSNETTSRENPTPEKSEESLYACTPKPSRRNSESPEFYRCPMLHAPLHSEHLPPKKLPKTPKRLSSSATYTAQKSDSGDFSGFRRSDTTPAELSGTRKVSGSTSREFLGGPKVSNSSSEEFPRGHKTPGSSSGDFSGAGTPSGDFSVSRKTITLSTNLNPSILDPILEIFGASIHNFSGQHVTPPGTRFSVPANPERFGGGTEVAESVAIIRNKVSENIGVLFRESESDVCLAKLMTLFLSKCIGAIPTNNFEYLY